MANLNTAILFNGPLEVGLRSLLLLTAAHPKYLDHQRLVILDYLLVHSGDLPGGPPSLHPPSPLRAGEVSIRRQLVQQGLLLLESKGLVARRFDADGIHYVAEDLAPSVLDACTSPYVHLLRDRAGWAVERAASLSDHEANELFGETLGRWRTEFIGLPTEDSA
jgi:hypothetical protein